MTNTKMVMAEHENVVVVAHRDEYISDDDKDPEICKFKNIQTFPFGHRREVTCLDMDEVCILFERQRGRVLLLS